MVQNIFVVDLDRCIGCKGCLVACKMEHGIALGSSRNKVFTIGPTGTYPDLEMYFLPVMCQQCDEPSCVSVCPTGACYKSADNGTILIDKEKCIGCKRCIKACPYEINTFNNEMRVADKCDQCIHLQEIGEKPACVKNCAGKSLIFGDINDPNSPVSLALKEAGSDNIYTIRNSGSNPTVKYILRNAKWIDVILQECTEQSWRKK